MSEPREQRNRARLEASVHASEQLLRRLLRDAFAAKHPRVAWEGGAGVARVCPKLAKTLKPIQRAALSKGDATKWDLSLLHVVMMEVDGSKAVMEHMPKIVNVRNQCAHAASGRIPDDAFKKLSQAVSDAYIALGGDADEIQAALRETEAGPTFDVATTEEAVRLKAKGNRAFAEQKYRESRRIYSRGIDLDGVVDPRVLAELHSNRAAACKCLGDFDSAKADAKIAAKLAPTWPKPHVRMGELYVAQSKHRKAASSFETALRMAKEDKTDESNGSSLLTLIERQLAAVRLLVDKDDRRESDNLAYDPQFRTEGPYRAANQAMAGLDSSHDPGDRVRGLLSHSGGRTDAQANAPGLGALRYVVNAHLALQDGRFHDAARGYLAAANAGSAEGMYNYAVMLSNGRGVEKDVSRAAQWLVRAAAVEPTPDSLAKHLNVGIGEALATLGRYYDLGINFKQSDTKALEYWKKSAEMDVGAGLNSLALCYQNGSNGVNQDLAKARDLLRSSAEKLHNEAMTNLAVLHATVNDFDAAARWAEAAATYGYLPAKEMADDLKRRRKRPDISASAWELLKSISHLEQNHWEGAQSCLTRDFDTVTVVELRAVGTPYAMRLATAIEGLDEAERLISIGQVKPGLDCAAAALRVPHAVGLLSDERLACFTNALVQLRSRGVAPDRTICVFMALDSSEFAVEYADFLYRRGEFDPIVFQTAAVAHFHFDPDDHPDSAQKSLDLFRYALTKVPHPMRDSDPHTMQLLFDLANAFFVAGHAREAASFAKRFLRHAVSDGHRLASETHFLLGFIELNEQESHMPDPSAESTLRALEHLRDGLSLSAALPVCFREGSKSRFQGMLEIIVAAMFPDLIASPLETDRHGKRQGGELVFGPRRHPLLVRSDKDLVDDFRFVDKWRKKGAAFGKFATGMKGKSSIRTTMKPPRMSRPILQAAAAHLFKPTTIDELLSGLQDHVYEDRRLEAIVVAEPYFSGSSYSLIIEDSQREPMRVALYNASESLMEQLTPGCSIVIFAPYLRITEEGEIMIRVDEPAAAIRIDTRFLICWVCSLELASGEYVGCSHCGMARYCSEKCKERDWDVYGHQYTCSRDPEKSAQSVAVLEADTKKKKKNRKKKKKNGQHITHVEQPEPEYRQLEPEQRQPEPEQPEPEPIAGRVDGPSNPTSDVLERQSAVETPEPERCVVM